MVLNTDIEQLISINRAFKPTRPIDHLRFFAGRKPQIHKIVNAITLPGAHVLLYGERGVGKTSLVSILHELFHTIEASYAFVRVNCDGEQQYTELWRRILRGIKLTEAMPGIGFKPKKGSKQLTAEDILPDGDVYPDDIRHVFSQLPVHPVIILDEVDRMKRDTVTFELLADTVKALSDHGTDATLIIVAVANDVDEIIGEHPSVERALVQIQLPRMSEQELLEALDQCLSEADMQMMDDAKNYVVLLSRGLPHYVHLLGLHSARLALQHSRKTIVWNDVEDAIRSAGDEVQQSIRSAYIRAIDTSQRDTLHRHVLLACALAEQNELGYFGAGDVRNELVELLGRKIEVAGFARHMTDFASPKRGKILERIGEERQYRYRFSNPLMQPYVLIKGVELDLLDYARLNGLRH